MRILAVLMARTSSRRLPGKVLKRILGRPMLALQIERIQKAVCYDELIVATSGSSSDGPIQALCEELEIPCFRGSLEDVADRYYRAASQYDPKHVLKLSGDCPLTDPGLIDALAAFHRDGGYDFSSNALDPTWPDGLDAEIFTMACLERIWREAKLPSEREHLVPYLKRHPESFRIGSMTQEEDLSRLRWTVDEPEDFELVSAIYKALYTSNPNFSTQDILNYLAANPNLNSINGHFLRNAGVLKALEGDGNEERLGRARRDT